jgi:hypothetical protein
MKTEVKNKGNMDSSFLSSSETDMHNSLALGKGLINPEEYEQTKGGRKSNLTIAEFKTIANDVEAEEQDEVPFSEKSIAGKVLYIL